MGLSDTADTAEEEVVSAVSVHFLVCAFGTGGVLDGVVYPKTVVTSRPSLILGFNPGFPSHSHYSWRSCSCHLRS